MRSTTSRTVSLARHVTGFAAPAEMSGGLCRTWVEFTLTLQGEGNAVLQVNPSVSTPWETEGAAWIESVETL